MKRPVFVVSIAATLLLLIVMSVGVESKPVKVASTSSAHRGTPRDLLVLERWQETERKAREAEAAAAKAEADRVAAEAQAKAEADAEAAVAAKAETRGTQRSTTRQTGAPASSSPGGAWDCIREKESGNDYGDGNGGAYQFLDSTWHTMPNGEGGYMTGSAQDYPPSVQDAKAIELQERDGWSQWTTASRCGVGG